MEGFEIVDDNTTAVTDTDYVVAKKNGGTPKFFKLANIWNWISGEVNSALTNCPKTTTVSQPTVKEVAVFKATNLFTMANYESQKICVISRGVHEELIINRYDGSFYAFRLIAPKNLTALNCYQLGSAIYIKIQRFQMRLSVTCNHVVPNVEYYGNELPEGATEIIA